MLDKDSEMCLWLDFDDGKKLLVNCLSLFDSVMETDIIATKVFNPRRSSEDDPPPPPIPRRSWIEIDL